MVTAVTLRAVRLIQLIGLLQDRSYTTAELAGRLGVDQRTVQRDLSALQGEPLRVPLIVAEGRWRAMAGWRPRG